MSAARTGDSLPVLRSGEKDHDQNKTSDTYQQQTYSMLNLLYLFIASFAASRLFKKMIKKMYPNVSENINVFEFDTPEGWTPNSKVFECICIVPSLIFAIYFMSLGTDLRMARGNMSHVNYKMVFVIRSWSILLLLMFAFIFTCVDEPLISTPIIVLTILSSFSGYFILEPYMVSFFHVFSTVGWVGLFDLSQRSHSIFGLPEYPFQFCLAIMLLSSCFLRSKLENKGHYNSVTHQYVGIPLLLMIYWSFEIPVCEIVNTYMNKDIPMCEFHNFQQQQLWTNENEYSVLVAFLIVHVVCHVMYSKLFSTLFNEKLGIHTSPTPVITGDNVGDHVGDDLVNPQDTAAVSTSRGSHTASRLEGGRVTKRDRDRNRARQKDCGRAASDSISSTDSLDSVGSMTASSSSPCRMSPITSSATSTHPHCGADPLSLSTDQADNTGGEFLPTLSLLSSLPLLSSFSLPFASQSTGQAPATVATTSVTTTTTTTTTTTPTAAPGHVESTGSSLPSSFHLLDMLPSLSPMPVNTPWNFFMQENNCQIEAVTDTNTPTKPAFPLMTSTNENALGTVSVTTSMYALQQTHTNHLSSDDTPGTMERISATCTQTVTRLKTDCGGGTSAPSPLPLDNITEAEAVEIVQKGLLHVKTLRAN